MVAVDGMSYRDAADALDIPLGTLMSRLARGREALRRGQAGVTTGATTGEGPALRLVEKR
jgi:RNA polymerase sigma-70 factor (ECF subfamily)